MLHFIPYPYRNLFRICCLFCLVLLSSTVWAQGNLPVFDYEAKQVPASPEAAAIMKFIDIPVSQYTGLPSINIPLTTIAERSLSVPISLSYHASGHKVNELANWVGLGWKLNAGGMITRKIRGLADDSPVGLGFLKFREQYTYEDISQNLGQNNYEFLYESLAFGCWDSEPDEFYFSVGGMEGTFAYDWNHENDLPVISSTSGVKIERVDDPNGNEILSWKLTSPEGFIYTFDVIETSTRYPEFIGNPAYCGSLPLPYTSSWYLSKIEDPNFDVSITFEYDNYSYQRNREYQETRTYNVYGN
ncbi:MAG: hypothetical protein AAF985_15835, partial [Bacteroidota bacterium]